MRADVVRKIKLAGGRMYVREARVLSKRAIERVHHRQELFTMLGLKI